MIAPGKAEKKAARTARLSAALRENLKRRKAQARGRVKGNDAAETPSPEKAAPSVKLPTFAAIGAATRRLRYYPDTDVRMGLGFRCAGRSGPGTLTSAV